MWTDHGLKIMQRGAMMKTKSEWAVKVQRLEAENEILRNEIDLLRGKLHEARRAAREKLFPVPKGRDETVLSDKPHRR